MNISALRQTAMDLSSRMIGAGSHFEASDVRQLKQTMSDIRKSLITAGYQTPAVTTGGDNGPYSPLMPESLDQQITMETYKLEDELCLLSRLKAGAWKEATQTVEQIPVLLDRGNANPMPLGFSEGNVPGQSKANFTRRTVRMKYIGKAVQVTDQAAFIRGIADRTALDWETEFNMHELLRQWEWDMWHADPSIDANDIDGFISQMEGSSVADRVVVDYRGAETNLASLQDVIFQASRHSGGFGRISDIFLSPEFEVQFDRDEVTKVRHMVQGGAYPSRISYGNDGGFQINLGSVMGTKVAINGCNALDPDSIGNSLRSVSPSGATADVPTTPVLVGNPVVAVDAASKFVAGDAGDYAYAIVAVGEQGVSAPLFVEVAGDPAITVAAGEDVTLTIDDPADGKVKYYRIYRTEKGVDLANNDNPSLTKYFLIGRVAYAAGADTVFADRNDNIAGCSSIVLMDFNPEYIQYRELLPMMRRPLATLNTTQRFLMMEWGNLHVKSPIKHRVLKNLKPARVGS